MNELERLRVLPFPLLVDEAWRVTRRGFRALFPPLALGLAPVALVMNLASGYWSVEAVEAGSDPFASCGVLLLVFAVLIAGVAAMWVLYGVLFVAVVRLAAGQGLDWGAATRTFLHPRVWGTDLVAWLLVGLGFLACIVPGILLMAIWGLRIPVMVFEGRYGGRALSRSWELLGGAPGSPWTRHPLLKMLLIVVLGTVLGYAVAVAIQLPPSLLTQLLMFREVAAGVAADPGSLMRSVLWLTVPVGVVASLAQLALRIYLDFVVALFYFDQWRRREGGDLDAALDRLAAAVSPGAGETG